MKSAAKGANTDEKRADAMCCEEICVYSNSCVKSMYIGGIRPRYHVDLLMGQSTNP